MVRTPNKVPILSQHQESEGAFVHLENIDAAGEIIRETCEQHRLGIELISQIAAKLNLKLKQHLGPPASSASCFNR